MRDGHRDIKKNENEGEKGGKLEREEDERR